eukprot:37897-Chlamydomonas_euryale.AAC.24
MAVITCGNDHSRPLHRHLSTEQLLKSCCTVRRARAAEDLLGFPPGAGPNLPPRLSTPADTGQRGEAGPPLASPPPAIVCAASVLPRAAPVATHRRTPGQALWQLTAVDTDAIIDVQEQTNRRTDGSAGAGRAGMRPLRAALAALGGLLFVAFAATLATGLVFVGTDCPGDAGSAGCTNGIVLCAVAGACLFSTLGAALAVARLREEPQRGTAGADTLQATDVMELKVQYGMRRGKVVTSGFSIRAGGQCIVPLLSSEGTFECKVVLFAKWTSAATPCMHACSECAACACRTHVEEAACKGRVFGHAHTCVHAHAYMCTSTHAGPVAVLAAADVLCSLCAGMLSCCNTAEHLTHAVCQSFGQH